ncbi:HotDog domain-containing protein [Melanogaster broomeanus]|nr:HotDog domain-containing protein [Melanogaster broomeanus]
MDTKEWIDVAAIGGNASIELKQSLADHVIAIAKVNKARGIRGFEPVIYSRIEYKEVSVLQKAEEPEKLEGRVVCEMTVENDMLNGRGTLHGACSALLIDNCSAMPIALLSLVTTGKAELGVSQSMNVLYHAPAMTGDRLRIVSTTITLGSRTLTARCEIWNITEHRLVASGVHTKMTATEPTVSSKL